MSALQIHKLFRRQTKSHGPDTGPVGGQAQGAHVRHGPVERAPTDGSHGRRVAAGTRTRPVAVSHRPRWDGCEPGLLSCPRREPTSALTRATHRAQTASAAGRNPRRPSSQWLYGTTTDNPTGGANARTLAVPTAYIFF